MILGIKRAVEEIDINKEYKRYLKVITDDYNSLMVEYSKKVRDDADNPGDLATVESALDSLKAMKPIKAPYKANLAKALDRVGLYDGLLCYSCKRLDVVPCFAHIITEACVANFEDKFPNYKTSPAFKRVMGELWDGSGMSPYAANAGIVGLAELSAEHPEFFNLGNFEKTVASVSRVYKALGLTSPIPNPAGSMRWALVDFGDGFLGLVFVLPTMVVMLKSTPRTNPFTYLSGGNGGMLGKQQVGWSGDAKWGRHMELVTKEFMTYYGKRLRSRDIEVTTSIDADGIADIAARLEDPNCTVITTAEQDNFILTPDDQELFDSLNGYRDKGLKKGILRSLRLMFKPEDLPKVYDSIDNFQIPTDTVLSTRNLGRLLDNSVFPGIQPLSGIASQVIDNQQMPMGEHVGSLLEKEPPIFELIMDFMRRNGSVGVLDLDVSYARNLYNTAYLAVMEIMTHYLDGRWFYEEMQALKRTKGMVNVTPVRTTRESFLTKFPIAQEIFDKGLEIGVTYKVEDNYVTFVNTCSKRKNIVNLDDLEDTELKAMVVPATMSMQGSIMVNAKNEGKLDILLMSSPEEIPFVDFMTKPIEEVLGLKGDWVESDLQFGPRLLYIGMNPELVGMSPELLVQSGILHVTSEHDITAGYNAMMAGLNNPLSPTVAMASSTLLTDEVLGNFAASCAAVLNANILTRNTLIDTFKTRIKKYYTENEPTAEELFKFIANVVGPELLPKMLILEPLSMEPTAVATGRLTVDTAVKEVKNLDEVFDESVDLYGISQEQIKNAVKTILRCSNFVPNLGDITNELPFNLRTEYRPAGLHNYTGVIHGVAKAITRIQRDISLSKSNTKQI